MICLFHWNRKTPLWKWPYNNLFYPNLTIRYQKVENGSSHTNSKLLVNLTFWKTEYLIAQLRTGFRQKVYRLKTCPQGVLEAQQEKSKNLIFTTLLWAGPALNPPLNSLPITHSMNHITCWIQGVYTYSLRNINLQIQLTQILRWIPHLRAKIQTT